MNVPIAIARIVQERAAGRCEYCRMHQSLQGASFHVEHIVPRSRVGTSDPANLCLACPGCNLRKSDRTIATDPDTKETVSLFNPRLDRWHEHFLWKENQIIGLTAVGRATIALLELNHPRRLRVRDAEKLFGLFPPDGE